MKIKILLLLTITLYSNILLAQIKQYPLKAKANSSLNREDWFQKLQRVEKPINDEHNTLDLTAIKQELKEKYNKTNTYKKKNQNRSNVDAPLFLLGLEGNTYNNSVPNDNDIAVSNSGYLISVMNSTLFKYDLNADTLMGKISLQSFSSALGNLQDKYDPKCIYDPEQNKFIVVYLAGFTPTTSSIIVAFSETDNPNGNWNYYELPGDPLNDTLWTDYPIIAMTHNELFITVNLLLENEPWQTGWIKSIIWQVNKEDGYNGDSLTTQLHSDISFNNRRIRNLCAVKGGSQLYGPDIYFLSQRNLDPMNDSIFIIHLTDTIGSANQELNVTVSKADNSYFLPIDGEQIGGTYAPLATNDSRVLGAFIENDKIQFVGNTTDTFTNTSACYHGIISNLNTTQDISLNTISNDTLSYGYPNISYASNNGDNTAIIHFLKSSTTVFPGYFALRSDGVGDYSEPINVKSGLAFHSGLGGSMERWGDYTGSQVDYANPGYVWVNGSYATTNHKVNTYIARLGLNYPSSIMETSAHKIITNVFPNPVQDYVSIEFDINNFTDCSFLLYDMNGRLIATLLTERVKPGKNLFSFSTNNLTPGTYLLSIQNENGIIASQKIIK